VRRAAANGQADMGLDPIPMLRLIIARFLGIDTAPKTRRHI
jgi:hypothetical protein